MPKQHPSRLGWQSKRLMLSCLNTLLNSNMKLWSCPRELSDRIYPFPTSWLAIVLNRKRHLPWLVSRFRIFSLGICCSSIYDHWHVPKTSFPSFYDWWIWVSFGWHGQGSWDELPEYGTRWDFIYLPKQLHATLLGCIMTDAAVSPCSL